MLIRHDDQNLLTDLLILFFTFFIIGFLYFCIFWQNMENYKFFIDKFHIFNKL